MRKQKKITPHRQRETGQDEWQLSLTHFKAPQRTKAERIIIALKVCHKDFIKPKMLYRGSFSYINFHYIPCHILMNFWVPILYVNITCEWASRYGKMFTTAEISPWSAPRISKPRASSESWHMFNQKCSSSPKQQHF